MNICVAIPSILCGDMGASEARTHGVYWLFPQPTCSRNTQMQTKTMLKHTPTRAISHTHMCPSYQPLGGLLGNGANWGLRAGAKDLELDVCATRGSVTGRRWG